MTPFLMIEPDPESSKMVYVVLGSNRIRQSRSEVIHALKLNGLNELAKHLSQTGHVNELISQKQFDNLGNALFTAIAS